MYDYSFYIKDYEELNNEFIPPDIEETIPVDEKERLLYELVNLFYNGYFDDVLDIEEESIW